MNAIILLFLLGVVLLAFEVVVPGGILGVMGGLCMLSGCALAFYFYGASSGGLAILASGIILGFALYLEFVLLPKTRIGKKLFLWQSVKTTSQAPLAEAALVVGKICEAVTALGPSGIVQLEEKRYEAYSRSGFVEKGARLRVVGIDNFRLIVSKI